MSFNSMTGFARIAGHNETARWAWEVKSVNGRGLDLRCRFPSGFDNVEMIVRERSARFLKRGNVSLSLSYTLQQTMPNLSINEAVLEQWMDVIDRAWAKYPDVAPPRLDGILALRGIAEGHDTTPALLTEEERILRDTPILASFDQALSDLCIMRAQEGSHLETTILGHLKTIENLVNTASICAAKTPAAIRERFAALITPLLETAPALSPERLAQEAALLIGKADIQEELDRLYAHIHTARILVAAPDATGRKLDFLCQEFNREVNTLCSKSADIALTNIGLDLKATIEQLREQVQNVE